MPLAEGDPATTAAVCMSALALAAEALLALPSSQAESWKQSTASAAVKQKEWRRIVALLFVVIVRPHFSLDEKLRQYVSYQIHVVDLQHRMGECSMQPNGAPLAR